MALLISIEPHSKHTHCVHIQNVRVHSNTFDEMLAIYFRRTYLFVGENITHQSLNNEVVSSSSKRLFLLDAPNRKLSHSMT